MSSVRVGIQGWGSEGDVRPLIALAARLRREGHTPSVVLTPIDARDYRGECRSLDVPLRVVPEEIGFSLEALTEGARSSDPSKLSRAVLDLGFTPHVEAMYAAALDLCGQSDVVIGGASSWYVKAAALKVGIPFVGVDYYPGIVPSKRTPPLGLSSWGQLDGVRWALLQLALDLAFKKAPAAFFAGKGLPVPRHAIPDVIFSETLNLHAASPTICPPAPDWSEIHQVCGEFFLPDPLEQWTPSPSLQAFLAAGAPPLLVSLGSMEHMAPQRARNLLIESVRTARVRAILQTKRESTEGRDGDLYFLPWAPHRRLLALCSVVVHHGGAGTTHAVLRAGRPSVVLPFIFEQKLWAGRLEQLGAAPALVSFWNATPGKVANRIREALESEAMHARASELAGAMAAENGTGRAVSLLEELMKVRGGDAPE
jgi:UDP:flavonoid glycosyltransferase YjiC (YdhE family)